MAMPHLGVVLLAVLLSVAFIVVNTNSVIEVVFRFGALGIIVVLIWCLWMSLFGQEKPITPEELQEIKLQQVQKRKV